MVESGCVLGLKINVFTYIIAIMGLTKRNRPSHSHKKHNSTRRKPPPPVPDAEIIQYDDAPRQESNTLTGGDDMPLYTGGDGGANIGGKVIDSGGYGCIFKPALKCEGEQREPHKISKLMTLRHSRKEYDIIRKYKEEIKKIPNYKKYFLLDNINICTPDELTKQDLVDYQEKCTLFQKQNITKKNINNNLRQLLVLNMPDGGIDIGEFMYTQPISAEIVALNNALIDLLHYGIIPMNKMHIYHCDVKESNVLIKPTGGPKASIAFKTRIIDWGLATKYNPYVEKKIPSSLLGVPFQYNLPFSNVLFNDTLESTYAKMLMDSPSPNYDTVRKFAQDYILVWMEERGPGHFKTISEIFVHLGTEASDFIKSRVKKYPKEEKEDLEDREIKDREIKDRGHHVECFHFIAEYITEVLIKYTINGKLMLITYFNEVFIHNADIWGFVMIYSTMLEMYYNVFISDTELTKNQLDVYEKLREIFVRHLLQNVITKIDTRVLMKDLKALSTMCHSCATVENTDAKPQHIKYKSIFDNLSEDAYDN